MQSPTQISAAIVCFNEDVSVLIKTVDSFLKTPLKKKLFLINNGDKNDLQDYFSHPDIEHIFTGKNIGFGKAHNLVLDKITASFHLILNPDVIFDSHVIPDLIKQLQTDKKTSFITPKVLNINNKMQLVCRKHPTFFDLLNRKLKFSKKALNESQYQNNNFQKVFYPEFIHGCFMLFKTSHFKELKGFDTRYFLYLEDADICREIEKRQNRICYFPLVSIVHGHQRGSSKNIKLFLRHTSSAIKYFLKWGF